MRQLLSTIQEKELRHLHRSLKDSRSKDMIKAILLLNRGFSALQISEILLIDDDTVRNWKKKFESSSCFEEWLNTDYKSRECNLTTDEINKVKIFMDSNIITDSKQVIDFVNNEFGIKYSSSGMVSLLHRIGYEFKNTVLVPSKFDAEAQEQFKKNYEGLVNNLPDDEVVLFGDGVHPQHNTTCSKAWIKKGSQKEIKSNTGRNRLNLHGAYNPLNQDLIIHEDKTLNTDNTIKFLTEIESFYKDKTKIYLILDNAKYYKNENIEKFIKNSRIEIIYLPPYSPNLNLIERLWKFMRRKVINNRYYEKFAEFKSKILEFFSESKKIKDQISKFIGQKLHLFKP